ncbi:pentatricopeptide repeat-containing protein At3g42630 [Daucus carota subsp. sativus]|uniref:pentatricopeptide repeat-containing protein At3g42630 n=1 Tax=Daucus carota subsp. sativus TaxID=79200 RepID=UPI0007EF504D|nr:PREDICTED: pentatricopeptide repeat-containing protein At3g42630-like [Daucus carota subsp. sativus]XP_017255196.1 PREDICTED: pentatricopeptide repeat-containing protein At3g42630-like [Daucus carota subsp. sativus]XP_017255197.1 PREDICTED: pentatricopeptide repeat-containing protein At3g42630-like [Daucus carota subsp. sativus]
MEALSVMCSSLPRTNMKSKCSSENLSRKMKHPHRSLSHKLLRHLKQQAADHASTHLNFSSQIINLSKKKMPHAAEELALEMISEGHLLDYSTFSALFLCYAKNDLLPQAQATWDEILYSSYVPNIQMISALVDAYGRAGLFNKVTELLHQVSYKNPKLLSETYALAISCFGKAGQLNLMESAMTDLISKGFKVDSKTGNAFIVYYSTYGTLTEMEDAYGRLKRSRILIEKEGIQAISYAYIKNNKFYNLGEFIRDVGLGRRNVGNLLWNLLLLSYAANFKMKSLQREFSRMIESGFCPDLTTFNIRALAFSKMSLFWDLHVTLKHMKHYAVVPDLVTYGSVVDAYMDRRLGRNLEFALSNMRTEDAPVVSTDKIVFEVLGKGDFHSSSEVLLEFNMDKYWTYKGLIKRYLKRQHRSNQVFWNY